MAEFVAGAIFAVLIIGSIVLWGICMVLFKGYVLATLWAWFAVPIFHLPPLSVAQAIALMLLASLFTPRIPEKDGEKWQPFVYPVLFPLMALGVGYIVKGYL